MTNHDPEARARALGITLLETWDYDTARAGTVERMKAMRTENPPLWRAARALAFDLRAELGEDLPGIPAELVEQTTITVLAKVLAMAIGMGADPTPVINAGSIASLAVLDEFWTKPGPA
jgi:hypothetical protein